MKSNKAITGLLSVSLLLMSATTVFATDLVARPIKNTEDLNSTIPISAEIEEVEQSYFDSFTGVIKEIMDYRGVEGSKIILLEDEMGGEANMIITKDTYMVNPSDIVEGAEITGYYDAFAPRIMIFPPQYKADVLVIGKLQESIKVDFFDTDLISGDRFLKLNVSDDTKIILQDGSSYDGELAGRKLVVLYDVATKSIPAQTNPIMIIVLKEEEIPAMEDFPNEIVDIGFDMDFSTMDIIVNNEKIIAPSAYRNNQGDVMVPLRSIAEALALEVEWEGNTKTIIVDEGITFKIGEDHYTDRDANPIQLGSAPQILEGRTFIPLSFFREVAGLNNAYIFEGQIVIDNGEKME